MAIKTTKLTLLSVFFVVFIDNFGYSLVFNLLGPLLLVPEYGMISQGISVHIKNILLAVIFGIYPLAQFFTAPILGELADKFGRKKALFVSLLGLIVGFSFSAAAIFMKSVWFFFFSRLWSGAFAGNISICMATIADVSKDEKERGKNFSLVTAIFGMSWIIAMVVGGYLGNPELVGRNGPGYIFLATAIMTFGAFFFVCNCFTETFDLHEDIPFSFSLAIANIKEAIAFRTTRVYFLIYGFWSIGWVMAVQWFPAYSMEVFHESIVMFTSWYLLQGVFWTLGAFFAKYVLIPRLRTISVAFLGFSFMTILVIAMQFVSSYGIFGALFCLASFFAVFSMSSSLTLISMYAPKQIQGKVMGLSQSVQSMSFVLISMITFVLSMITISYLFMIAGLICLIPTVILAKKCLQEKNQ